MRKRDALFAVLLSLYPPFFSQAQEPVKPPFAEHEEVLLLKKVLPDKYHSLLEKFYWDLLNRSFTQEDIDNKEKIPRAQHKLYMDLKFNTSKYLYLTQIGATKASLDAIIGRSNLESIVDGFQRLNWPTDLIHKIGSRKELIAYSKLAAENDSDFSKGIEWAKTYLIDKLSARLHTYRWGTDYHEDADQIVDFNNKHTVFLLKKFVDFFDSKDSASAIVQLFGWPKMEQGGFFFDDDTSYKFVFMRNAYDGLQAKRHYLIPGMRNFLKHIGLLHTHIIREKQPRHPGPSGISRNHGLSEDDYSDDLGVLRLAHCQNPYWVDVVVTELGNKRYNVDLYFQDVYREDCDSAILKNLKVLDIGIFDFN